MLVSIKGRGKKKKFIGEDKIREENGELLVRDAFQVGSWRTAHGHEDVMWWEGHSSGNSM